MCDTMGFIVYPQRLSKRDVIMNSSFFKETFNLELVSLLCVEAYFVYWAKGFGPPLVIPKTLRVL